MECEYCGRFKPGKRFCSDECTAQDAAGYLIGKFEEWLNAGNSLQEGLAAMERFSQGLDDPVTVRVRELIRARFARQLS